MLFRSFALFFIYPPRVVPALYRVPWKSAADERRESLHGIANGAPNITASSHPSQPQPRGERDQPRYAG
jgi:hypothetical protein